MKLWKHSDGVFRTPWRVYWYLFYFISVGSSSVCRYRCSFLLWVPSEPNTLFIQLYDRCRVPMTSICREVTSSSGGVYLLGTCMLSSDSSTLISLICIWEDVILLGGSYHIRKTQQSPRYTISSYTCIQETSQRNPTIFKFLHHSRLGTLSPSTMR